MTHSAIRLCNYTSYFIIFNILIVGRDPSLLVIIIYLSSFIYITIIDFNFAQSFIFLFFLFFPIFLYSFCIFLSLLLLYFITFVLFFFYLFLAFFYIVFYIFLFVCFDFDSSSVLAANNCILCECECARSTLFILLIYFVLPHVLLRDFYISDITVISGGDT